MFAVLLVLAVTPVHEAQAEARKPVLSRLDREIICHAKALTCESKCETSRQSAEGVAFCKTQCRNAETRCVKRAQAFEAPPPGNDEVTDNPDRKLETTVAP